MLNSAPQALASRIGRRAPFDDKPLSFRDRGFGPDRHERDTGKSNIIANVPPGIRKTRGAWGHEAMTVQMVPPPAVSPAVRPQPAAASAPPIVVLLAIAENDVNRYPTGAFTIVAAHTTDESIHFIERIRPHVLAIDWDLPSIDGIAVCRAATELASATMLVTTESVERVPSALKAGCHSVLLKPFSLNLAAGRLGRLCRELSVATSPDVRAVVGRGTNRTWPDAVCPRCVTAGATSFDHSSYRRTWYACLRCEHVWLGARQD